MNTMRIIASSMAVLACMALLAPVGAAGAELKPKPKPEKVAPVLKPRPAKPRPVPIGGPRPYIDDGIAVSVPRGGDSFAIGPPLRVVYRYTREAYPNTTVFRLLERVDDTDVERARAERYEGEDTAAGLETGTHSFRLALPVGVRPSENYYVEVTHGGLRGVSNRFSLSGFGEGGAVTYALDLQLVEVFNQYDTLKATVRADGESIDQDVRFRIEAPFLPELDEVTVHLNIADGNTQTFDLAPLPSGDPSTCGTPVTVTLDPDRRTDDVYRSNNTLASTVYLGYARLQFVGGIGLIRSDVATHHVTFADYGGTGSWGELAVSEPDIDATVAVTANFELRNCGWNYIDNVLVELNQRGEWRVDHTLGGTPASERCGPSQVALGLASGRSTWRNFGCGRVHTVDSDLDIRVTHPASEGGGTYTGANNPFLFSLRF
jgi:hypothetical protein